MRMLFAVVLVAASGVMAAAPGRASGPCLFQGDWDCYAPRNTTGRSCRRGMSRRTPGRTTSFSAAPSRTAARR